MMRSGFRFDPPRVNFSGELRWLLQRAFGPPEQALLDTGILDGKAATELAGRFHLAERVGARTSPERLVDELGQEAAGWFREEYARAAARYLVVGSVCRELGEVGRLLEIPTIFLKGAALQLDGRVVPGSRNMADVDVLVPEDRARQLQKALVDAGCNQFETRESEHQLQLLTHRLGLGIEVHKTIPGVRFEGGPSATANELIEKRFVQTAPGLEDGSFLPNGDVILAHAVVHGIAQHGLSPEGYPMARMLADIQDLGVDAARLAAFLDEGYSWIASDVSREEVNAVVWLVRRLGVGEDPADVAATGDEVGAFLRHVVANATDQRYAETMKFRGLTVMPGDRGRVRSVAKTLRGTVFPTNAQIDILYGQPRSEIGYWAWRLWRPFDLVIRAARYGVAWGRHQLRIRN